jgi:hypothetical protein
VLRLRDLVGHAVLLAVHLRPLLRSQLAAVGCAIIAHFLVDLRFILLQVCGLSGAELTALHTLRNAVLLILRTLADFAGRIRFLRGRIMLVLIDLL